MQDGPSDDKDDSVFQVITRNLGAVISVAGHVPEGKKGRRIFSSEIQKDTGIARSTVRALTQPKGKNPNPDLRTLEGLSKFMDVQLPFLLMGPEFWNHFIQSVNGLPFAIEVARKVVEDGDMDTEKLLLQILTEFRAHPEKPHFGGRMVQAQKENMDARNLWRERACRAFGALIDTNVSESSDKYLIAAFVASYVNLATPEIPNSLKSRTEN